MRRRTRTAVGPADPEWYRDAVIYELHVRSFQDSTDDGIGDFPGLTSRLGYLQDLGVTAIWLLPFYPSPLRDDGYDIADYRGEHPAYGDWKERNVSQQLLGGRMSAPINIRTSCFGNRLP